MYKVLCVSHCVTWFAYHLCRSVFPSRALQRVVYWVILVLCNVSCTRWCVTCVSLALALCIVYPRWCVTCCVTPCCAAYRVPTWKVMCGVHPCVTWHLTPRGGKTVPLLVALVKVLGKWFLVIQPSVRQNTLINTLLLTQVQHTRCTTPCVSRYISR